MSAAEKSGPVEVDKAFAEFSRELAQMELTVRCAAPKNTHCIHAALEHAITSQPCGPCARRPYARSVLLWPPGQRAGMRACMRPCAAVRHTVRCRTPQLAASPLSSARPFVRSAQAKRLQAISHTNTREQANYGAKHQEVEQAIEQVRRAHTQAQAHVYTRMRHRQLAPAPARAATCMSRPLAAPSSELSWGKVLALAAAGRPVHACMHACGAPHGKCHAARIVLHFETLPATPSQHSTAQHARGSFHGMA